MGWLVNDLTDAKLGSVLPLRHTFEDIRKVELVRVGL